MRKLITMLFGTSEDRKREDSEKSFEFVLYQRCVSTEKTIYTIKASSKKQAHDMFISHFYSNPEDRIETDKKITYQEFSGGYNNAMCVSDFPNGNKIARVITANGLKEDYEWLHSLPQYKID